jgi:hypothetical protein
MPAAPVNYTHEYEGRRTQVGVTWASTGLPNPTTSAAVYNAANELTNWNGATLTYYANGNTISSGGVSFAYNFQNQLVQSGGVSSRCLIDTKGPIGLPQAVDELQNASVVPNGNSGRLWANKAPRVPKTCEERPSDLASHGEPLGRK